MIKFSDIKTALDARKLKNHYVLRENPYCVKIYNPDGSVYCSISGFEEVEESARIDCERLNSEKNHAITTSC